MNPARLSSLRYFWIGALCALALGGCNRAVQNDPVQAMDHFFALMGKQRYQEAYDSASVGFRIQLSEASFEAIAKDLHMGEFNSMTWTPASAKDKEATLDGEFVSTDNKKLVISATVIKEDGIWKVYSMRTPAPNDRYTMVDIFGRFNKGIGFDDMFTREIPNEEEAKMLVLQTMLKFNEGLHKKDFTTLYNDASQLWQSSRTLASFTESCKSMTDKNMTIDGVKNVNVIFTEQPRLDAQGFLLVKGYYPTLPSKVNFAFKYVFEMPKWKLEEMMLSIKD